MLQLTRTRLDAAYSSANNQQATQRQRESAQRTPAHPLTRLYLRAGHRTARPRRRRVRLAAYRSLTRSVRHLIKLCERIDRVGGGLAIEKGVEAAEGCASSLQLSRPPY